MGLCKRKPKTSGEPPVSVVNQSTAVSDEDVGKATKAVGKQLTHHFCPAWELSPNPVGFVTVVEDAPTHSWVILVGDTHEQAKKALGFHAETREDLAFGWVSMSKIIELGGSELRGPLSMSTVLSHEVLEIRGDASVNKWYDTGSGELLWGEVCDMVQRQSYPLDGVSVSNFALPAYFDPGSGGPYDYLNSLSRPFQIAEGGYMASMTAGQLRYVRQGRGNEGAGGHATRGSRVASPER